MKSLKIIIFRDTDKPYTIIIPSSVIVAVTFSIIAIFTLLSFSIISNVMLYAETEQTREMLLAEKQEPSGDRESDAGEEQVSAPDGTEDSANGSLPETESANAGAEQQTADSAGDGQTGDNLLDDTGDEQGSDFDLNTLEYTAAGANVQADVLGEMVNRIDSVTFNAQVSKITDTQAAFTGRFVASLTDADGNGESTYPDGASVREGRVQNPERGTTFSIRRLRNYNGITLRKSSSFDYEYLTLFIYTEDGTELLWRKVVPLP